MAKRRSKWLVSGVSIRVIVATLFLLISVGFAQVSAQPIAPKKNLDELPPPEMLMEEFKAETERRHQENIAEGERGIVSANSAAVPLGPIGQTVPMPTLLTTKNSTRSNISSRTISE
jgi:hypothetical protein